MCLPSRSHRAVSQASSRGSEKRAVLSPRGHLSHSGCYNQLLEQKCNWLLSRWCPEMLLAKHPTADQTVRNYEQLPDPKCQSVSELRNYVLEQGCPTFQTVVEWCHPQMCWVEFTALLRCTWPVMQPVGHRLDMPAPTEKARQEVHLISNSCSHTHFYHILHSRKLSHQVPSSVEGRGPKLCLSTEGASSFFSQTTDGL